MTPIGTKYSAVASLCEQRTPDGTYHQRMPWPGYDMDRLQGALLRSPRPARRHVFAVLFVYVLAIAAYVVL